MLNQIPLKKFLRYLAFSITLTIVCNQLCTAQKISQADKKRLIEKEDSLRSLASDIILDSLTASRMRSDSLFVKTLIRALQIKNSFYYPFDSVQGISKLYAPDST